MRVLGIETSCDETGVAVHCTQQGVLAERLYTQAAMHERYGGVVPELASRDHIIRLLPLVHQTLAQAGIGLDGLDAIAYTRGPGLAGALLVGASLAHGLGIASGLPVLGIHHLEGHLLSPLLAPDPPDFPFVALLVSGGHTQLHRVDGVGRYHLLGDTVDDAAGEAFDKSAKLLGLGYPGGPALARAATQGTPGAVTLPRPKQHSADLDFSFSGLKTAVRLKVQAAIPEGGEDVPPPQAVADIAHAVQEAITDVLVAKCVRALQQTGLQRLVVSGGVSANARLRQKLAAALDAGPDGQTPLQPGQPAQPLQPAQPGSPVTTLTPVARRVHFPAPALCTDNGAMIAFAASLRLQAGMIRPADAALDVMPRWPLESLDAGGHRDVTAGRPEATRGAG